MPGHRIGIVMNGVTGRMGANQHLIRSIVAIREQGGVVVDDGDAIWPEPVLVGRSGERLERLAAEHGIDNWTTDLDGCLGDETLQVYFDAQSTSLRRAAVTKAIAAGKHVYCEKPLSDGLSSALELVRSAREAEVKTGIVQDKLFLPGIIKLSELIDAGFFGRILSVRLEFGYWVFEGCDEVPQRPSWNYRQKDGGGIILDMFPHWRYLFDHLFGGVRSVFCLGATHIPSRVDENGATYECTADDAVYAILELNDGVVAQVNSSWCTRVNRDDLLILQVDGTKGSAVAGLRACKFQSRAGTPRAVWDPDVPVSNDYRAQWLDHESTRRIDNPFKYQWEAFLRHVAHDIPWRWDFLEGAKGVQLAELGHRSWQQGCRLEIPELRA